MPSKRFSSLLFLFLAALVMSFSCCSCSSAKHYTSDSAFSVQASASAQSYANERLSLGLSASVMNLSDMRWVTVDPNVDVTHSYTVIAQDGKKLMLPNNATGYGVRSEVTADTSHLTIDQETVNLSGCSMQSSADNQNHEEVHYEAQAFGQDFISSLKLILWTICALAACAVVLYFRTKFRR